MLFLLSFDVQLPIFIYLYITAESEMVNIWKMNYFYYHILGKEVLGTT